MALSSAQVNVGAAATALTSADTGPSGTKVVVRNSDATNAVALGNATVAAGTGYRLLPGAVQAFDLAAGEQLFGIQVAAAVVVDVLRTGE